MDSRAKTFALAQLIRDMDGISYRTSDQLRREGHFSVPVPCFFPIRVRKGKLHGLLSLKHLAELGGIGSIGLSTLLLSRDHGNRLCLAAFLTEKELEPDRIEPPRSLCTKCKKCLKACPTGAISDSGVAVTRCLNVSRAIPRVVLPLFRMLLGWNWSRDTMATLVNTLAWSADMVCSGCLVSCPFFRSTAQCPPDIPSS